ncbi:hypothetical protein [Ktedonospora formicarum]|uniref:Uncharacterized protein n=1 Tax=Ktedonospora formicarum TaxID=2778364 RepID=A0A8J3HX28_9CHLR|nr:hypothetical protein [Ktedonospora formicarum]GHO42458.1 hypothetical protein KSX_06210 [Ktedonospora formicarum]
MTHEMLEDSAAGQKDTVRETQQRLLHQLDDLQQEFKEQARDHTHSLADQVRQHQEALSLFRETLEQWLADQRVLLLRILEDHTLTFQQTLETAGQQFASQSQRLNDQDLRSIQLQETVANDQEANRQLQQDMLSRIEAQGKRTTSIMARQAQLTLRVEQLEELTQSLSTQLVWQGELVQQQYQALTDSLAVWGEQIEAWRQETDARLEQMLHHVQPSSRAHEELPQHPDQDSAETPPASEPQSFQAQSVS